jgi:drug/metabolite transporter (DMT)-like permease
MLPEERTEPMKAEKLQTSPAPSWIAGAPALFVVMWATGFIVARLSAHHVEPLTFLAIRFGLACVALTLIARLNGSVWPGRTLALRALVAGVLLQSFYLGPIYWAVTHGLPAGISALIAGLQPLLTALLAPRYLGETIDRRQWAGVALGLVGLVLVLWPKLSFDLTGGITPTTVAVCFIGTMSITAGTIYQKKYATGIDLASGTALQYAGGFAVLLIGALLFENFHFDGSRDAWIALVWSIVILSLISIPLLMLLIRHGDVSRVSGLIFLVPGVAAAMAFALFGETLTIVQIAGMAVCAAAVLLVTGKVRERL